MRPEGLKGIPQKRRWRRKATAPRPSNVTNRLGRDFTTESANAKFATDITFIETGEHWLSLSVVFDSYADIMAGWSMSGRQDRQLVIQAVLMALWQRESRTPVYYIQAAAPNLPARSTSGF